LNMIITQNKAPEAALLMSIIDGINTRMALMKGSSSIGMTSDHIFKTISTKVKILKNVIEIIDESIISGILHL
jgi:hypothetical protein